MNPEYKHLVEVILCRDCDYYDLSSGLCKLYEDYRDENDYCSRFEKQLNFFTDDML